MRHDKIKWPNQVKHVYIYTVEKIHPDPSEFETLIQIAEPQKKTGAEEIFFFSEKFISKKYRIIGL